MPIDPVALVRRYHAALNRYTAAEVAPMFAADAIYQSPGVGALRGREAIIAAFTAYFAEYPDQHALDEKITQTGDMAAVSKWRLTATSRSTGEPYHRRGSEAVSFNGDGLIVRVDVEDQ